jgi:type VI secretion system protein ImpL
MFIDNAIAIETEEILAHISRLKAESEGGGADLPVLTELRDVLQRLDRDLNRPELQWLSKDSLELGDPFSEVLASLRHFSPDGRMSDELRQEWQQSHQQLRRRLLEVQLPQMGVIIARDNEKHRLVITQGLVELKANLETFLSLAFVQQNLEKPHAQNSEGSYRVVWNDDLLRQSTAFADAYDTYVRDRLGQVYRHIREVVKSTALERLGQNMPALVAQARREERVLRFSGDVNALQDELSSEVGDLKRVSSVLRQILETYDRLTLKAPHSELYQQLQEDSREILRRIDLLPEREEMYRVSSKLASWRGDKPPVLAAFDVEDADALSQYIKTQRNRMKGWGRDYAKVPVSLLDGLTSARSDDPLVGKWRNIVNQLEYFERMTPGNSVKEMESFFDTTLITVTPENCLDKLPRQTGDNTDFFLQTKARVHDSVRKRCLVFAAEKILELYEHLARRFNQDLAGKFPFTRNAQSLDDPDAIPRDIRGFFQEYDEFIRQYDAYVGRRETLGGSGEVGREVSTFLQSLREVRPFFAPLLGDRGDLARYNVSVDYRINKSNEINGQQIAEWGFSTGDQKVEDGQGAWQLGDRVRLSMRWAKDGPYVPAPTGQPRGATVDSNDSISFDFAGIWGLVRIIRMFRASQTDLRKSLDRQPHVLKFMVDIAERKHTGRVRLLPDSYYTNKGNTPSGAAKMAFLYNKAVVFVRIVLNPPESKELLVIPVDWPTLAPLTRGRNGQ